MNERYYTSKLVKKLKEGGSFAYKVPDLSTGIKPFDIFCVNNGVPLAIECKMKKVKSIKNPTRYLTKHQEAFLEQFEKAGGTSLICFFSYGGEIEIFDLKGKLRADWLKSLQLRPKRPGPRKVQPLEN